MYERHLFPSSLVVSTTTQASRLMLRVPVTVWKKRKCVNSAELGLIVMLFVVISCSVSSVSLTMNLPA